MLIQNVDLGAGNRPPDRRPSTAIETFCKCRPDRGLRRAVEVKKAALLRPRRHQFGRTSLSSDGDGAKCWKIFDGNGSQGGWRQGHMRDGPRAQQFCQSRAGQ